MNCSFCCKLFDFQSRIGGSGFLAYDTLLVGCSWTAWSLKMEAACCTKTLVLFRKT